MLGRGEAVASVRILRSRRRKMVGRVVPLMVVVRCMLSFLEVETWRWVTKDGVEFCKGGVGWGWSVKGGAWPFCLGGGNGKGKREVTWTSLLIH